ncbi:MAG: hypothetical protein ABII21_03570 [bacterium]
MSLSRGQSIVETVIAAGLISIAVIAALSLSIRSQKQSTYARKQDEATKYATQALDWFRTMRSNSGWSTLADLDEGTYCLNTLPIDVSQLSVGDCSPDDYVPGTQYQRSIVLDTSTQASGTLKATITVSWYDNALRQTTIEMELSQWR